MNRNLAIETKKNKPALTLRQLDNPIITAANGEPATLYQIAFSQFSARAGEAIEAAQSGDFSQIEKLQTEIRELQNQFIDHLAYLNEEKAILKDPDGPEARRLKELTEYAER